jgi:hypothetical protein
MTYLRTLPSNAIPGAKTEYHQIIVISNDRK